MNVSRGTDTPVAEVPLAGAQADVGEEMGQRAARCRELRDAYRRLCVVAVQGQHDQLWEEVGRTEALVADLRRMTAGSERPQDAPSTRRPGEEDGSAVSWSQLEELLSEVVEMQRQVLQLLGGAVAEKQAELARLGHGSRALGRYRILRSSSPRLQSSRI
jgi:hypothetical protein